MIRVRVYVPRRVSLGCWGVSDVVHARTTPMGNETNDRDRLVVRRPGSELILSKVRAGIHALAVVARTCAICTRLRLSHQQAMHRDQPLLVPTLVDTKLVQVGANEDGSLSRHPDLWFSDGSVVLKAESTSFRVHTSQLMRRSAFFRDLFSLPRPGKDAVELDGTYDGCPLLVLHDSAEDLSNLLKALYDGGPYVVLCLLSLRASSYPLQCTGGQWTRGFPRRLWRS